MIGSPVKPPFIVIAGATASGKSRLAAAVAARVGGTIINADASQIYGDLHVLTARPGAADEARVPHRLYGVRDGSVACSAAEWAQLAKTEIAAARAAGQAPVLVGGTGLYLRTLLDGIAPIPSIDADVRARVRSLSAEEAHAGLSRADPAAAARLKPTDRQRIARALEVVRATGRTLAHWQRTTTGGIGNDVQLDALVVEVDPAALSARIEARLRAMIEGGALDELAALLARALDPALPIMKAVGVRPFAAHLAGELTLDAAITRAAAETRQYAKRQRTWFRNQTPGWTRVGADLDEATLRRLRFVMPA
jgi:tRNA dimethylallyltransferase